MEEKKNLEKKETRGGKRPNAGRKAIYKNKSIPFSTRFSPEIWKKIEDIAQACEISKSDAVALAVEKYNLTKHNGRNTKK